MTTFGEWSGCVDYIYFKDSSKYSVNILETLELPNLEMTKESGGIPSDEFGSDHFSLIARMEIKKESACRYK